MCRSAVGYRVHTNKTGGGVGGVAGAELAVRARQAWRARVARAAHARVFELAPAQVRRRVRPPPVAGGDWQRGQREPASRALAARRRAYDACHVATVGLIEEAAPARAVLHARGGSTAACVCRAALALALRAGARQRVEGVGRAGFRQLILTVVAHRANFASCPERLLGSDVGSRPAGWRRRRRWVRWQRWLCGRLRWRWRWRRRWPWW